MSRILLCFQEPGLEESILHMVDSVAGCTAQTLVARADELAGLICRGVAVVLVHDTSSDDDHYITQIIESASRHRVPVVVISERGRKARMPYWMSMGARDCLARDVDLNRLPWLINWLTVSARVESTSEWLEVSGAPSLCIASEATQVLLQRISRIIDRPTNVLITGETGTGKTHLSKVIHKLSNRASEPFVAVNCAAIPESLVESQLFGHARGAFTGADADLEGVFSRAGAGTLVLDEVDALPLSTQAKLLYAVDEHRFSPLGCSHSQLFKGRLMVATNRNVNELAALGRFRSDLYYRLSTIELHVAPLRERRPEIRCIAEQYVSGAGKDNRGPHKTLSDAAVAWMERYSWPGNVRQMHNVLEHSLAFSLGKEIRVEDFPLSVFDQARAPNESNVPTSAYVDRRSAPSSKKSDCRSANLRRPLQQARLKGELETLLKALNAHGNNRAATARELGISRAALYKRMKKLGL